jgi:hypothetical protein
VVACLVLAALAALVAGARVYHVRSAVAAVKTAGGFVATDTHHAHALRQFFGPAPIGFADGATIVDLDQSGISDAELEWLVPHLRQFDHVTGIKLANTAIADRGLAALGEFNQLRTIDLSGTRVGDSGLEPLSRFRELRRLHLDRTLVTDTGLVHLESLDRLELLNLDSTAVGDAGMPSLAKLRDLRRLSLSNTNVTEAGISILLKALPKLDVTDD